MNCNSVKPLNLLHVAFMFLFSIVHVVSDLSGLPPTAAKAPGSIVCAVIKQNIRTQVVCVVGALFSVVSKLFLLMGCSPQQTFIPTVWGHAPLSLSFFFLSLYPSFTLSFSHSRSLDLSFSLSFSLPLVLSLVSSRGFT